MARKVMRRRAADNTYFHRDFHCALNSAIRYLDERHGAGAVREYLRGFAKAWYAPLRKAVKRRGLAALESHFRKVYGTEGAAASFKRSRDELIIRVRRCPAVSHIRRRNQRPCRLFSETTRTVNQALCEGTPFSAELTEYDRATGRSTQRFYRTKT